MNWQAGLQLDGRFTIRLSLQSSTGTSDGDQENSGID